MKWATLLMTLLLLVCCTDMQEMEETKKVKETVRMQVELEQIAQFNNLIQEARWGDGQAYIELANCYRDGIGVERDFLGMMGMVDLAVNHGAIEKSADYLQSMPDDHEYKVCYELITNEFRNLHTHKDSVLAILAANKQPEAVALHGIALIECGEKSAGMERLEQAAEMGSSFAKLLTSIQAWEADSYADEEALLRVAEKSPILYRFLGDCCADENDSAHFNEQKAAHYYLKADEHALLSKREAEWLLAYNFVNGGLQLTTEDINRLEHIAQVAY